MEVICDVCNAVLSSKYILKTHMTTNKACLAIRNMELKTKFLCKGCNQYSLDMQKLTNHQEICKSYQRILLQEEFDLKLFDIETLNQKLKQQLVEKDKEIKNLETINEKLKEEISSLFEKENQNKDEKIKDLQSQMDKMFSTIENLAKQAIDKPTTINTNNVKNVKNVYSDKYFLDKLTPEDIKKKCRNHFTEQVFFQGQRGIARMCTDHIIHTKDDKVLLTCTDVSRKKFKYIDELGNIKEDYDARAFMEKVIGPIKQVGQEVYENILSDVKYEREELENKRDLESMERKTALHYKTDMAADCYRQIIFIDRLEDNNDFRSELAVLNK